MALLFYGVGEAWVRRIRPHQGASLADSGNRLRTALTRWLKTGLVAGGVLAAAALIDTFGGTFYAVSESGQLTRWGAAVAGAFGAIGAFARPLSLLLAPTRAKGRPGLSFSTISWVAAVVVMAVWLVCIDVASHAIRWGFGNVSGSPAGLAAPVPTPVLGADALVITGAGQEQTITARMNARASCAPRPPAFPSFPPFLLASTAVLGLFTLIFGQTRRFANLSSVHGFYTASLTRTFLGASNDASPRAESSAVVGHACEGDDCGADALLELAAPAGTKRPAPGPGASDGAAVGEGRPPAPGQHDGERNGRWTQRHPEPGPQGHRPRRGSSRAQPGYPPSPRDGSRRGGRCSPATNVPTMSSRRTARIAPEPLSLGRWMSISGAAFSAAAGANTTVPSRDSLRHVQRTPRLLVEFGHGLRRSAGWNGSPARSDRRSSRRCSRARTARRVSLWNISDGGHFENMGGYELIRRRLPVIVIVDAEADPDYTFQGLSDLVRKARLDFKAGDRLPERARTRRPDAGRRAIDRGLRRCRPGYVRYFGDLDSLRRGKWTSEELTDVHWCARRTATRWKRNAHVPRRHTPRSRASSTATRTTLRRRGRGSSTSRRR